MRRKATYYRSVGFAALVVGSSIALLTGARAEPITYTMTGDASGILNGIPYTNAPITIMGTGDTNNIVQAGTNGNLGLRNVLMTPSTVTVSGVGSATLALMASFTGGTAAMPNGTVAGFSFGNAVGAGQNPPVWQIQNPAFLGYDLGPIGPTPQTGGQNLNPTINIMNGGGTGSFPRCDQNTPPCFNLSSVMAGTAVFSATLEQPVEPPGEIPLPATFPLFASGLGALGLLGWRRKRRAPAVA